MHKPLLQVALDSVTLEEAISNLKPIAEYVDIIEIGTILACSEGVRAISIIRSLYPKHIIVCDFKTTDAGAILAEMAFEAGADWLTVSAAAHPATKLACKKVADKFNELNPSKTKKEIQIELYGNWTLDDAKSWLDMGIKQAIYHRSRDAELSGKGWLEDDLHLMQELSDLGIEVSITGGIVVENIKLFKNIKNAKAFIAGRALTGEDGIAVAQKIHTEIEKFW